jgi:hypothetical protein
MIAFLPLNLHRPVDDGAPAVALIDASLLEAARQHRWLTTIDSAKPMRSVYRPEVGAGRLTSLARWVWEQTHPGQKVADYIGHDNHDLLDCRAENLVSMRRANLGRYDKTGVFVQQALEAAYKTAASVRAEFGVAYAGEPARRGRSLPYTSEQADEVRRLRAENAAMPLNRFNAEIVAEVVGKKLGHRILCSLLAS